MADSKISQLPDGDSTATTSSVVAGAVSGVTKKISISKILSLLTDSAVTSKLLTGFSSEIGTVAATDTILQAFNKLSANVLQTSCNQAPDAIIGSGTYTFDCSLYGAAFVEATGSFSFAFSNVPPNVYSTYVFLVKNFGSFVTFPAYKSSGGLALVFSTSGVDRLIAEFDKNGALSLSISERDIKHLN